jgi:hypothetical protein
MSCYRCPSLTAELGERAVVCTERTYCDAREAAMVFHGRLPCLFDFEWFVSSIPSKFPWFVQIWVDTIMHLASNLAYFDLHVPLIWIQVLLQLRPSTCCMDDWANTLQSISIDGVGIHGDPVHPASTDTRYAGSLQSTSTFFCMSSHGLDTSENNHERGIVSSMWAKLLQAQIVCAD